MLKKLARIFGIDRSPPPPPKRKPTARKAKAAAPVSVAAPAPARPAPAPVMLPGFALACRTFIRQWGQHGAKPSPERLDAAAYVLGRDYSAFLTALHLTDGQLTRFLVPESSMTSAAVDAGMKEKLSLACYGELDVWSEAEKIDLKRRTIARQSGRPIPERLHIPDEVQMALIKRMNEAAERVRRGGGGARGGGVRPAPPEPMGAPEPAVLDPEGGGRSRMPATREPEEEHAETATGKPLDEQGPAPAPEDGEPEAEGGGPSLPRV